jgi:hypothetical protein
MRQIFHATNLQLQSNSKDIERLEQQVDSFRGSNFNKAECEIDLTKKLLSMERDVN